jgi:DNA-binding transcriptional LysR family regulator
MSDISATLGWSGVELRHLVTLRTVADERSLAGAARRLGYSQPAVSQQLAALERIVGARLVERRPGAREIELTAEGRLALRHADAILARARAADAELRALEAGLAGTLRLGTIPSVGARLVPELLRRVSDVWPTVDVELVEIDDDALLLDRIESGDLDLAFVLMPVREGPFEASEVLRDPYILAVAADSPLATARKPVRLNQLAELPLIVCTQSYAPEALLHAHGIEAQIRFRIDTNETVAGLAAAGLGVALVPGLAIDSGRRDIERLALEVELPPRLIAIAWHRDRAQGAAAVDLVALATEVGAAIGVVPDRTAAPRNRARSS